MFFCSFGGVFVYFLQILVLPLVLHSFFVLLQWVNNNIMKKTEKQKVKESVVLWGKPLQNGGKSLYLKEYIQGTEGKGFRYECLKLYLLPGTSRDVKAHNKEVRRIAEAVKAQRLLDIANGRAGIKTSCRVQKKPLMEWLKSYAAEKAKTGQSKSVSVTINNVILHLQKFHKGQIYFCDVDSNFCLSFLQYLSTGNTIGFDTPKYGQHHEKPIAKSTAKLYFNTFNTALREAVRLGYMEHNPIERLTRRDKKKLVGCGSQRAYLDEAELVRMAETECRNETVKKAFMFACYCGLRYSDISNLKWADIAKEVGTNMLKLTITQVKTKKRIEIPLPQSAVSYLPTMGESEEVFCLPTYENVNKTVQKWAVASGVEKKVTFHVARHTYATRLLTKGADLYTVSKLLGHQNLRTTQIYAEIVDKKKVEAVNLLD